MMLFLAGNFIGPSAGLTPITLLQEDTEYSTEILNDDLLTSELPNDRVFRVALYNETNSSTPNYANGGMNTNYSAIHSLLATAGYDVDIVTLANIQNYELTLANYDVLVLADNCPRENITDLVKEFWLGGGGVLSLDSSISYIAYAGILYRENETVSDGWTDFWAYATVENSTIPDRHPVTQSYQDGDLLRVTTSSSWANIKKAAFNTTSVWPRTTILAESTLDADWVRAVAVDPTIYPSISKPADKGGKVVQIGTAGGGNSWATDYESMIVDAINWLAPRPRARMAYDFSHAPRLSVDAWDAFSGVWDANHSYAALRNEYVLRQYTFDKFYPSATGNFTAARLAEYDIMIICWPDFNYTEAERAALLDWVDAGGGLILLGDRNLLVGWGPGYKHINFLLEDFDMYLGEYNILDDRDTSIATPAHPTTEGCANVMVSWRNYINITGPSAQAVWKYEKNVAIAAQEYGDGRVMLFSDMNALDNFFVNETAAVTDNWIFAINVANWLAAADAKVLVYSDDPYSNGVSNSAVPRVLNQMEIPFYLTWRWAALNNSLNGTWYGDEWDLVIVDNVNFIISGVYSGILDYLQTGRQLIMTTFGVAYHPNDPLWAYMGANYSEGWDSNEPAYIWDSNHPVFDGAISYAAPSLNVSNAFFADDGDKLTVFDNATALAGFTATEAEDNASIVLRNDGQTLLNTFLLVALAEIDHPADIEYESGTTGNTITWTPSDAAPASYEIFVDGVLADNSSWDGSAITYNVDGLALGVHAIDILVYGNYGEPRGDTVQVTVVDTIPPLLNRPANVTMVVNTTGNSITWLAYDPNPSHYVITMNTTAWDSGIWDGDYIELELDDLAVGVYSFTLRVNDTLGHYSEDVVLVTVTASTEPTPTDTDTAPTDTSTEDDIELPDFLDNQALLTIIGVQLLLIVILFLRRRK
jgi:hypothetical protein